VQHENSELNNADFLYGLVSIAGYLGIKERSAKHLIETKRIPYSKVGKTVCSRRSWLASWMESLKQMPAA
jgi:excisionase family DNA binding protein